MVLVEKSVNTVITEMLRFIKIIGNHVIVVGANFANPELNG